MSDWTYEGKVIDKLPEDCEAFVYLITNKKNGMKYVGKKLAKFKTTKPPLKGKKNKRQLNSAQLVKLLRDNIFA